MRNSRLVSRRAFIGNAGAAVAYLALTELTASEKPAPARLSQLDRFNYIIGTQTFSPLYHFTKKPRLIETAEVMRQMGSSVIKLRLRPEDRDGAEAADNRRLPEVAQNNSVIREILEMPFSHFLLWAYSKDGGHGRRHATTAKPRDEEIYELACCLLQQFNGTGKTFYLGHWEGDWEIRGQAGGSNDPSAAAIATKLDWLNCRQQAVDDAKRDTSHSDVNVYCYAEVNRVKDCMKGRPGMINSVVPRTNIDFISYSSYDSTAENPAGLGNVLDYMETQLPLKKGIFGKRIFIGEYGYPISKFSPIQQDKLSRELIKEAVRWGCPFVLYWEMYNNELDKDGKQRGFWLIDDKGVKQPVYHTHEKLCQWGRTYVAKELKNRGAVPAFEQYQRKLLEYLEALA
jgi:hypothetical protein